MLRSQLRHVTVAVAGLLFFAQSSLARFTQQGPKLIGAGAAGPAQQGYSIALSADGNTAIIGGPADPVTGAAWIFARSRGVWTQQGPKLVGVPDGRPSFQGWSVALSADGNTAILGAPDAAAGGTAWVFTRSGGTWTQQGSNLVYVSEHGNAQFGWSVALSGDGNTALVGGRIGEARVYTRAGSVWTQQGPKLVGIGAV
jgi:hypothetical protein